MSSDFKNDVDFDRDFPTSAADSEALREHRPGPMSLATYVRFLKSLPAVAPAELRNRKGPCGPRFTLF